MSTSNMNVAEIFQTQREAVESEYRALNAAIAIAQMDPHSWSDLKKYREQLEQAKAGDDAEAVEYLVSAIAEVFERTDPAQSVSVEQWEASLAASPGGQEARAAAHAVGESFFKRYTDLKARAGFKTQRDVAEAAGLSVTTVQAIEARKTRPQAKTIQALARAFGVDASELAG